VLKIDDSLTAKALLPSLRRLFELSGQKIERLERRWNPAQGTPVFTVKGQYGSRGWTEWTQGFQFGAALLQFDATGEQRFLELGRAATVERMASHLTHVGVHDHGFNNVSTYGNLLRLMREGRIPDNAWERRFYELALKASGAVQAARWTRLGPEAGYVYSFNGPHSLFADTIRSLRALAVAHQLGHVLMGEGDRPISLLGRLLQHAETTARFNVYFGAGRDAYDVRGRVAHESIFNLNDGAYRCPSSQQGYSPFSTWTRGQAWIVCGYAEELEFLSTLPAAAFAGLGDRGKALARFREVAEATADFFIAETPTDGIPTGTRARQGSPASATTSPAPRIPPTSTSRWTARRRPSPPRACCAWGTTSAPRARRRAVSATGRRRSPSRARCSPSLTSPPTPRTRGWSCTPSTTAPTAGTTCRPGTRCPLASRRCGATTTRASSL
jgi:hypothetical protein